MDLDQGLRDADIAAIVTAHPQLDYEAVVAQAAQVIDFRGVTRDLNSRNVVRL